MRERAHFPIAVGFFAIEAIAKLQQSTHTAPHLGPKGEIIITIHQRGGVVLGAGARAEDRSAVVEDGVYVTQMVGERGPSPRFAFSTLLITRLTTLR
jgi:hypothetical protein